ncbi:hypothetical protein J6590_050785 [Homalodisca vitripennis]|nr:hypothetical protein J6590_050785 [Homalodisca vitripennis]
MERVEGGAPRPGPDLGQQDCRLQALELTDEDVKEELDSNVYGTTQDNLNKKS